MSKNNNLVKGYVEQLEAYKRGEKTKLGYYVVIDVGQMGGKYERLLEYRNAAIARGDNPPRIFLIDGTLKLSASKL